MNLLKSYNQEKKIENFTIPNLSSFYIFLKFHPLEHDYTNYIKLHLLNTIVKKNHPEGLDIEAIKGKRYFLKIFEEMKKKGLDLNAVNLLKLSELHRDYLYRVSRCSLSSHILEKCTNEEYQEAFSGIKIIFSQSKNDIFGHMMIDVVRITLLRLCSSTAMTAQQGNNKQAMADLELILQVGINFLEKEEIIKNQIQIFADEIIERISHNGGNCQKLNLINEGFNNFVFPENQWRIELENMEKLMENSRNKYEPDNLGFNKTDNGITMRLREQFQRFKDDFWVIFISIYINKFLILALL